MRQIKCNLIWILLVFFVAGTPGHLLKGEEPMRFVQDRFAIGFWVDPPMDEKGAERYKEIAEANFTLVIGGFGAGTAEQIKKQVRLCEENGLKGIVGTANLSPENYISGEGCWGFLMQDEPNAAQFPALASRVAKNRELHPGKLSYINLFPNYANAAQLGKPNYEEYVASFMETVRPDVLSMDYYPIFKPDADGRDGYCGNLDVMRRYSLKYNVPFWNFFNVMPFGPHTDPTEGQIRWQIYSSLAYGAKGILYFCYYTPGGGEFPKGGAIIRGDGTRTRHYEEAKRINGELKNLGGALMQLTSAGVYRVTPKDNPSEILKDTPIKDITRRPEDPELDYLIGIFKHKDGRTGVLINNYRFAYTAWPTVEFRVDLSKIREIDKARGVEAPLYDDSPEIPGLQISLGAGDGRLFVINEK
ncbi:beta-galactosidase [Candidatus Sumerlaeota bacterium]|nr:beta-galactosidase [Candidatus Sumerlaeota bacterium]